MLYMQSTSASDGTYVLTVTFKIGMNPDTAQVLVQNRVSNALAQLPPAVQAQGVSVQKRWTAILQIITLDSPGGSYDALYLSNYATINLVNELSRLPGVGNVKVFGAAEYAMRIWLDPQKLYSFGLVPQDVIKAVQQQSQVVAAGQTGVPPAPQNQDFQYTVDIQSRFDDPGQFAEIIVKGQTAQGGRLIRVKDVGRIELGSQTYSQLCNLNGRPAAGIAIYQTPDANSVQVGKEVAAKMADLARRFPQDLRYDIPYNTTIFIKASIDEVYHTLYEAGILVLIVILIFLQNFRATLVPATTVTVTIIGAFAGMAALGFTVNLSTLFGIVLAIGIVVDDAIVIVEAVSRYIERGMSGHDAAVKAMGELIGPIIGITLVLMAVFLPAAFLPGLTGKMLAQFAMVIAVTAFISAINALTLKPTQCALWLRQPVPPDERNFFYRGFNAAYNRLENAYAWLIGALVKRAGLVVLIGLIVSALGIWGIARLPTAFVPNEDQGYAMIAVQLPDGAALGRTVNSLNEATKIALATPGVKQVITIAGISVLDNSATLSNAGVNYVIFDDWDKRAKAKGQDLVSLLTEVQKKIESISDGRAFVLVPPPIQGIGNAGGFQMQVQLLGGSFNYTKLNDATQAVVNTAKANPQMQRIITTFRPDAPHVGLTVDRVQSRNLASPGRRSLLRADLLCWLDLYQSIQQIRSLAASLCAGRLSIPSAAERPSEYVCSQPGRKYGSDRNTRPSRPTHRAITDYALQSLPIRHDHRRARKRLQFGPGDGFHGGCRRQDTAERRRLRMERDVLSGKGHRESPLLGLCPVGPACLSCPRRSIRKLDPAARRDLGGSACTARPGDNTDESRGRQ